MNKVLELFSTPKGAVTVADVGCGPWGGVFFARKWEVMYGVDPSWDFYKKHSLVNFPFRTYKHFTAVQAFAESFVLPKKADIIFCINAVNHCGDFKQSVNNMMNNLNENGVLLFHVHLRSPGEVEPGHPMALCEEDITSAFSPYAVNRMDILEQDPIRKVGYRKTAIVEASNR